jgi:NitT/TauT family transport system ATP-binding protein
MSHTTAALLTVDAVRKAFPKPDGGELLVLEGVNLRLEEGQIVGLLGRSGSGKSTLLRLIAGLSEPSAGALAFRGQPIAGRSGWRPSAYRRPRSASARSRPST